MYSVNDQQHSYDNNDDVGDIVHQEKDHPMLRSSLNFLSQDQKLVLAERSSMISGQHIQQQPGAFSQTEEGIIPRKPIMSQDATLKYLQNIHQQNQSSLVDDNRTPQSRFVEDVPQVSLSEGNNTLEELQEQMNNFRQNFELEINNQVEDQLLQEKKRRKRLCWGICVMIVLLVLILSLTIPLVMKSQKDHEDIPTNVESTFLIESCLTGRYLDQNRYNHFRSIIISYHPNLTLSMDDVGTNANVALCWLSQYDKLDLNPYPIHTDTLVQRFVVVTLYFHFLGLQRDTNQQGNIFSSQNWLSKQDVCDWTLIGCQDRISNFRYVTSLDFSDVRLKSMQLPSEIALLRNLTKLNFHPNIMDGTIPLELTSLTLLKEFSVAVWGPKSGHLVGKIIEPWSYLETLSLDLSFPSRQLDFGSKTKLTYLELNDQINVNDHVFPNIQELTMLGKRYLSSIEMRYNAYLTNNRLGGQSNSETLAIRLDWSGDIPSYLWRLSNLGKKAHKG
jgi:hypothetical protein